MEGECGSLRQVLREKDSQIEDLQRRILHLEVEFQESVEKQQTLMEEKNKLVNDNLEITQDLRKTKKDLSKLHAFKKAIMNTFEEGDNSDTRGNMSALSEALTGTSPKSSYRSPKAMAQSVPLPPRDPLLFEPSRSIPFSGSTRSVLQGPTTDTDT